MAHGDNGHQSNQNKVNNVNDFCLHLQKKTLIQRKTWQSGQNEWNLGWRGEGERRPYGVLRQSDPSVGTNRRNGIKSGHHHSSSSSSRHHSYNPQHNLHWMCSYLNCRERPKLETPPRGGSGVSFQFPNSCDFEADLRSSHSQWESQPFSGNSKSLTPDQYWVVASLLSFLTPNTCQFKPDLNSPFGHLRHHQC